jgi:hypothetical protein
MTQLKEKSGLDVEGRNNFNAEGFIQVREKANKISSQLSLMTRGINNFLDILPGLAILSIEK